MFSTLTSYIPFLPGTSSNTSGDGNSNNTPSTADWVAARKKLALPPVATYDVETMTEKPARTLKHLIKANHATHSVLYNHLQFHNHCPHILGTAYIFGSTSEHLNEIYEMMAKRQEHWEDSPAEITKDDWRDFLGKPEYQRAYVDFFEDQLVKHKYDWRKLLTHYLLEGPDPLINGLICGLGHSLIHLAYSHELHSRDIGIEALALTTCCYDDTHKYLDDPQYTFTPPDPKDTSVSPLNADAEPLELLARMRADARFEDLFCGPGPGNMTRLLAEQERAVLEYWNSWARLGEYPTVQFAASQRAAVALVVGSRPSKVHSQCDFFLAHLLTSSHAVRILLPLFKGKWQVSLVRQWWLFVVIVYACQLRPEIDLARIESVEVKGRDWAFITEKALQGDAALDVHYVKALRAMKEAADTWGDDDQFYLKAAIKFATEFDHWGGGLQGGGLAS